MTQSLNELFAVEPIRQKVSISAHFKRNYPQAIWELVAERIFQRFGEQEHVPTPDSATLRYRCVPRGLRGWLLTIEFEIVNESSLFAIPQLQMGVYDLLVGLGARRIETVHERSALDG